MTSTQAQDSETLLNSVNLFKNQLLRGFFCPLFAIFVAVTTVNQSFAVVKFFDGFGDADLNNNNIPLEAYDVDAGDSSFSDDPNGMNTTLTYTPGRLATGDPNNPGPTNSEVTSVLDSGDKGLKWIQMRGFTSSNQGRSKPTARIVDDTQGAMLETAAVDPNTPGALGKKAIDSGYALSVNSRGAGSSMAAFFGENVALGPELGDSLKVSFDFRIWRDAHSIGDPPEDAFLRFGLYQDTDNQLGTTNTVAGRKENVGGFLTPQPAIWGEEEGWFEGGILDPVEGISGTDNDVGAPGDAGWFTQLVIEDPDGAFPPLNSTGKDWRIREETNLDEGGANDQRILQGTNDEDTIATPKEDPNNPGDFGLINLSVDNVWNISLELVRATKTVDPNSPPEAAITANLSVYDLADPNTVYTLSGTELTNDPNGDVTSSVDNFDYFAIRNTGAFSPDDDFDYLIDNFSLELEGSNVPNSADFDGNGIVDGLDFLQWQRGDTPEGGSSAELALWEAQYGTSPLSAALAAVPEPSSALLWLLGMLTMRVRYDGIRFAQGG